MANIAGATYSGWGVNKHAIGVEIDGANDGTPITAEQRDAMIPLMNYFEGTYNIPLSREY